MTDHAKHVAWSQSRVSGCNGEHGYHQDVHGQRVKTSCQDVHAWSIFDESYPTPTREGD